MNFPRRTGQKSQPVMGLGEQLNPSCGGHVESTAVSNDHSDASTAQREIDRPDPIARPVSIDKDGPFKQALLSV